MKDFLQKLGIPKNHSYINRIIKTAKNLKQINMENQITTLTETNFEIGFRMQKEGYGISDSFGSAIATGKDNIPTDADIEEWMRGYNAAKAELEEKKTSLYLESLEQKLDNALEIETTESLPEFVNEKRGEQVEDLAYWKANAEEDYLTTPISVLRYIVVLEKELLTTKNK